MPRTRGFLILDSRFIQGLAVESTERKSERREAKQARKKARRDKATSPSNA
jgi:hypothetical protein